MRRAAFRNHGDSEPFGQSDKFIDSASFLYAAADEDRSIVRRSLKLRRRAAGFDGRANAAIGQSHRTYI